MSGLSAFFKQNKKETENVKFPASKSFLDEKGNPIEWEIKAIRSKEAENIRAVCNTTVKGKPQTDNAKFNRMFAAQCTVFPNLNDAELQNSYGAMKPEELITEMLDNDGEYQNYVKKCLEVSGYDVSDADLVEEAKN